MTKKRTHNWKNNVLILFLMVTMIFLEVSSHAINAWAKEEAEENNISAFQTLNPVIEVGNKIYVQHDEENNNVYELQKSGTGVTTVYEYIPVNFTAGWAWFTDGSHMEDADKIGGTSLEDYIPVKAGEEYFVKIYGLGYYNGLWQTPILFLDENSTVIGSALSNTLSASKAGVLVTVPEGATRMHLSVYNNQGFTLQKVLNLTDEEFDNLPINQTELETQINQLYEEYKKDRTVYQKLDKAYITFVNDDTRPAVDTYADLFIEKQVPLVLATVPEALIENASSGTETRLEVARRVQQAGGEIMAHNATPLTEDGLSDYSTMYSFFVRTKQLFNDYDLDVNGIIVSGGTGYVAGIEETEKWASSIYSYSDLYGMEYDRKEIALDSVYYHRRGGLSNYGNDLDAIKAAINNAIAQKSWTVFYFHDSNEINDEILSQVLDYVNSISETELEVVTYKEMYEKYATKESEILNTKKTYYVSSTGTSADGTNSNDPMSYETARTKTYMSGDTILLKRGDTFYGTFQPTIINVDDKVTTISAYGEGELPVILGYKIANSEDSWELYSEGIYKINLKDNTYFTGLTTTDDNSANIGFIQDKDGVKYYNRKSSLEEMETEYDFYCDGGYLYFKSDENPYSKLGELKLATRTNLIMLHSNMKIENLRVSGTGAHGMVGADEATDNVEISNNIIEDIGGSYLNGTTRYGNGIEFYGTDASNIVVEDNIIRNVYDVGFTIQGTKGSGKNVLVQENVFVSNSQDSEIWENNAATGVQGYEFTKNISVNAGRGWGYDARPDKYNTTHILFWGYLIEDTDIYFHHNIVYHPRRIYFIEQTYGTNIFFQTKDLIKSDYNEYFLTEEATIFRDSYKIGEKDDFIADYKKDSNSTFTLIEVDENIIQTAMTSDEIKDMKKLFWGEEDQEQEDQKQEEQEQEDQKQEDQKQEDQEQEDQEQEDQKQEDQKQEDQKQEDQEQEDQKQEDQEKDSQDQDVVSENTMPEQGEETEKNSTSNETSGKNPVGSTTGGMGVYPPERVEIVQAVPEEGTILSDADASYKVTVSDAQDGTVEYIGTNSETASNIVIPSTITVDGITYKVTSIADNAFKNNKKLKKVTIGNNIITIGKKAFYGCTRLKTVAMGKNVKTIKDKAFYKCSALTKITIPSKVTKIGKQAFYGCKKLTKITIKTTKLTSKKVGSKAFKGTPKHTKVKVPKSKMKAYKSLLTKKGISKKAKITK